MKTTVKTYLKLSLLKPKKRQHLTVLQQRKRAEIAGLIWNFLKSGTQKGEIVFQAKKYSLWRQSSIHETTECWLSTRRSWTHVNRLSSPEASICHGLGCSVKNSEIFSEFCETGFQVNTNVYIDDILGPTLCDMNEHVKNEDFTFL